MNIVPISQLKGKVFDEVSIQKLGEHDALVFKNSKETYIMSHFQECCESVTLEEISGDLQYLVGTPITKVVEESIYNPEDEEVSFTWTFYKLATEKGWVDLRWYGCSNGHYSEKVELVLE